MNRKQELMFFKAAELAGEAAREIQRIPLPNSPGCARTIKGKALLELAERLGDDFLQASELLVNISIQLREVRRKGECEHKKSLDGFCRKCGNLVEAR